MKVAIYARVSGEGQERRGTIRSQVQALRARTANEGHELVAEFLDDGYSGARLDRPGLDALRDAAEAGVIEAVWCLTPDRLARSFAYQMLVLDELDRLGCNVNFTDAPQIDDDPQARLLTQMQGVIAEYERAKAAERYRRGKLYRVRSGEAIFWKVPYGYRRVPRSADGPARLEIYEPEAEVVRSIFDDILARGSSVRGISRRLYTDGVRSPSGKEVWSTSTLSELIRNRTYMGQAEWFRHETVAPPRPGHRHPRQQLRPKEDWIRVEVPAILSEETFEAAQRVKRDNSMFSPRRTTPGRWLLRGLVYCGRCGGMSQGLCKAGANGTPCLQHTRRTSHSSELALICTAPAASRQASRRVCWARVLRSEVRVLSWSPDRGNPTSKRQGRGPGIDRAAPSAAWLCAAGVSVRAGLEEAIDVSWWRTRVKRRKAFLGGRAGPRRRCPIPVDAEGVVATSSRRNLSISPQEVCWVPAMFAGRPEDERTMVDGPAEVRGLRSTRRRGNAR
jgi:DNA invertase Pin-like site-specific DNA recombinase